MSAAGTTAQEPVVRERDEDTVLLHVQDVEKTFASERGRVRALAACDFAVNRGEFVCLVGPSGCGKSTLLRLMGGLIGPTYGAVHLKGRVVDGPDDDMSFLFQKPVLLPWLSVMANVLLPIRIHGGDSKKYGEQARALLELVGLEGFERNFPRELSGGMQQRVALARALVTDPLVLLMDEPFAALDALTRERMAVELQRIIAENQKTTVFVTHSISEAAMLADRIIVLSARPGTVVEDIRVALPRPRLLEATETPTYLEAVRRARAALERGSAMGSGEPSA